MIYDRSKTYYESDAHNLYVVCIVFKQTVTRGGFREPNSGRDGHTSNAAFSKHTVVYIVIYNG